MRAQARRHEDFHVIAVQDGEARQLTDEEDEIVNGYRFRSNR
jgi:hypothetical protein